MKLFVSPFHSLFLSLFLIAASACDASSQSNADRYLDESVQLIFGSSDVIEGWSPQPVSALNYVYVGRGGDKVRMNSCAPASSAAWVSLMVLVTFTTPPAFGV